MNDTPDATRARIRERWAGVHWRLHLQIREGVVLALAITSGQGETLLAIEQPTPAQRAFAEQAITALNDLATLIGDTNARITTRPPA